MPKLSEMVPKRAFEKREWDPNTPTPNRVSLNGAGPRKGHISKISKVFYEQNFGTKDEPKFESVEAEYNERGKLLPGIIPTIAISATYDFIKTAEGKLLEHKLKVSMTNGENSKLPQIMAAVLGVSRAEASDHDPVEMIGKPCSITNRNNTHGVTYIKALGGAIIDGEEKAVSVGSTNGAVNATAPVIEQVQPVPQGVEEDPDDALAEYHNS